MTVIPQVDLRGKFGPARNQGARPTCLAFATSDTHAEARGVPFEELSAEYIFYRAAQKCQVFNPHTGVTLDNVLTVLEHDGQPLESRWPYLAQLPADLTLYQPPIDYGDLYQRGTVVAPADAIKQSLDHEHSVLVVMTITDDFHHARTGQVIRISSTSQIVGVHAIVIVGYGEDNNESVYLIRNSWGTKWCEAGHAWLGETYLMPLLHSVVVMK
jgi:hypothetical protein